MLGMCRIACQCSQTATRYVVKREWAGSVSPVMWKPVVSEFSLDSVIIGNSYKKYNSLDCLFLLFVVVVAV